MIQESRPSRWFMGAPAAVLLVATLGLVGVPSAWAQRPAVVAAPATISAEGLPEISNAIPESVRRYTEARGAGFLGWHPVRREMLISTRFGNTNQLHQVKSPGADRTQLTFFEEPVGGSSYDPVQGTSIVFARDVGGNEFSQLYRLELASREVSLLTDGKRSQNGGVAWSRQGDRIAFASTMRNGADRDLYIMSPADSTTRTLVYQASGGGWGVADWTPDGNALLVGEFLSVTRSRLHVLDLATKTLRQVTPEDTAEVAYGSASFSADGKGVYLTSDRDSEFRRLSYLDLASGTLTALVNDIPWDVGQVTLSRDGRRLAFTANVEGIDRLYLMDTRTRRYRRVASLPQGLVGGLEWHHNGRDLGFTFSSARSTGDAWSLDAVTGALTRWTESELGGMASDQLVEPELVRWPSFDGQTISGFLYRPKGFAGKRPVIINIHGGPESQSRPGFQGRNNYFINELGIAIIYPNVRGSTGFGKTFVKLDNGLKREDTVKDIGALLDWIAAQPDLDASRVLVTGGSYGGYMTLMVATTYDTRICCSVDVVGISNLATFLQNTESYRRDLRRVEYGDERNPEMRAFMERTAPLSNASKVTKPLFVVQGANDPRVPRTEADQMVATVRRNGSPVWYIIGLDEGHGFRKKANADYQFFATVAFVQKYLVGAATL